MGFGDWAIRRRGAAHARLHAKSGGDGGEHGDDEVDDGLPGFFLHG